MYAYQAESHERAQQRGRQHIAHLVDQLKVKPREESIESAHRVYKMALQKGFTRGRRTSHVAAACLYLLCRQDDKPFFLIDFSDILQVSVFSLGAVFLQLAKLLRLENQPQFTKPVDPSLYIHRFADKMGFAEEKLHSVSSTAMRLVASMKRDWIQTGRRPSGVCGAALYIATHLHGDPRTKREIVNVVHIGEFTLSKRLNEFATTPAGEMNKQEFLEHSELLEKQEKLAIEQAQSEALAEGKIGGCFHVQSDRTTHFRQGMCKDCFLNFVGVNTMYEGANPPSFSKNREKETRDMLALEAKQKEEAEKRKAAMKGAGAVKAIEGGSGGGGSDAENGGENGKDAGEDGPVTRRRSSRVADKDKDKDKGNDAGKGGKEKAKGKGQEDEDEDEDADEAAPSKSSGKATDAAGADEGNAGNNKRADASKKSAKSKNELDNADVDLDLSEVPEGGALNIADKHINSAAIQAAEKMMTDFNEEFDKLEAEDDKKKRKKGQVSLKAVMASISRDEVEQIEGACPGLELTTAVDGKDMPLTVTGDFPITDPDDQLQDELDELLNDENLSDISDSEINQYIAHEDEVKCKEEIWNMMNQDWMEKQEAKRAAQEAQQRAQEEQRLAMERAQKAGIQYKRGRGRPLGSKSKPKINDNMPTAETPEEAAMRVMEDRKLSTKINYSILGQLFKRGDDQEPMARPLYSEGEGADEEDIDMFPIEHSIVRSASGVGGGVHLGEGGGPGVSGGGTVGGGSIGVGTVGVGSIGVGTVGVGGVANPVAGGALPPGTGMNASLTNKDGANPVKGASKKIKKSKLPSEKRSKDGLPPRPPPARTDSQALKRHGSSQDAGGSDKKLRAAGAGSGGSFNQPTPVRLGSLKGGLGVPTGPAGFGASKPIQRPPQAVGPPGAALPARLGSLNRP